MTSVRQKFSCVWGNAWSGIWRVLCDRSIQVWGLELLASFYSAFLYVPISHFLHLEYQFIIQGPWQIMFFCVCVEIHHMTSVTKCFVYVNTTSHVIFDKGFSVCQYITWHRWQCFLSVHTSHNICDKLFSMCQYIMTSTCLISYWYVGSAGWHIYIYMSRQELILSRL